ncbi:MAG TPA: DUF2863 family protein, partial [Telluria sp.]|nr:DUF2863 family protein [Telluria sp.]
MPRNKRPLPRKSNNIPQENTSSAAREIASIAIVMAEQGLRSEARAEELSTLIRRALRRKHDDVLDEAIDIARYSDPDACRFLRERVGEEAASQRIHREGAPEMEIDAFLIPLFARSTGGLDEAEAFADDAAFDELVASFQKGGLESPDATVVLVRHVYDLGALQAITWCGMHEILREAAASMSAKKPVPVPLLQATMQPWTGATFAPGQETMELRFLLGFALKRADDPFYAEPDNEEDADAYFDARMDRYGAWTAANAAVVRRCLAADPARVEVDFLYQDLFFGARDRAEAELGMLAVLSEVNHALSTLGIEIEDARAVVAVLDGGDQAILRTNLYRREASD